nr:hypothetical protein [Paracoccus liaowanqingii]
MIGSEFRQEGSGGHDEAHVAMPAVPGTGLAMVQSEIILCAQEAFFNRPALSGRCGEVCE